MAFKLAAVKEIKHKVEIKVPSDMGRHQKEQITVTYRKLSTTESKELLKQAQDGTVTDEEILAENVVDIQGVVDEDGRPVDYSQDLLEALCDIEYARSPLIQGFMTIQFGREAMTAKN